MPINLTLSDNNFADLVSQASAAIRSGGIAILAAEHGYVYICDAFNNDRIARIHALRGDAPFTVAQVMIGDAKVLKGLTTDFDSDLQRLTDRFWPGLLSLQLTPQGSLNWDLGDKGELDSIVVRVPARDLLREVVSATGPVAVASVSRAGEGVTRQFSEITPIAPDIAITVDEGALPEGPASTLLGRRQGRGPLSILREGAISRAELAELVPTIGL